MNLALESLKLSVEQIHYHAQSIKSMHESDLSMFPKAIRAHRVVDTIIDNCVDLLGEINIALTTPPDPNFDKKCRPVLDVLKADIERLYDATEAEEFPFVESMEKHPKIVFGLHCMVLAYNSTGLMLDLYNNSYFAAYGPSEEVREVLTKKREMKKMVKDMVGEGDGFLQFLRNRLKSGDEG